MGNTCTRTTGVQPGGMPGSEMVLFFPDEKLPCKSFRASGSCKYGAKCKFEHGPSSLGTLLGHLEAARKSLDICVFTITCDQISEAVLACHRRGVKVRIVTDAEQALSSQGSDAQSLQNDGVPVRYDNNRAHMHHKFCVIDGETVLSGSFNWTRAAVLSNRENVHVSLKNRGLAKVYTDEFNKLWELYKDNTSPQKS